MKIENISFTFENCEYITVDGKYVGQFLAEDIKTYFQRIACNAINKMETIHTLVIELHKDANKPYSPFGDKEQGTVFDRINTYNDITSICFDLVEPYPEDKDCPTCEHYDYYIHWTGDSDYSNASQKVYISDLGNLYLVISENKGVDDFFDKDYINNEEAMEFSFDMCDIGDKYSNPDRYTECE